MAELSEIEKSINDNPKGNDEKKENENEENNEKEEETNQNKYKISQKEVISNSNNEKNSHKKDNSINRKKIEDSGEKSIKESKKENDETIKNEKNKIVSKEQNDSEIKQKTGKKYLPPIVLQTKNSKGEDEHNINLHILTEEQKKENLDSLYEKTDEMEKKLKACRTTLEEEKKKMKLITENYQKLYIEITEETKEQKKVKKRINNEMSELEELINNKLEKMKFKKNKVKSSIENDKKYLFVYNSPEEVISVKKKQLTNLNKFNEIVEKDIAQAYSNLKDGYYIDPEIKSKNPNILSKEDELKYVLDKLKENIDKLKNDIQNLKMIKLQHENCCHKKKKKLLNELENVKVERTKEIEIEVRFNHKLEMEKNKKDLVTASEEIENKKIRLVQGLNFKLINENKSKSQKKVNPSYKMNKKSISEEKRDFFISQIRENQKKKIFDESNNNNINNDLMITEIENNLGEQYKDMLDEQNYMLKQMELNKKEITNKQQEMKNILKTVELKKFNLTTKNIELSNLQLLGAQNIRKLNKVLKDLKLEEKKYDNEIQNHDKVFEQLMDYIDTVNDLRMLKNE